MWRLLVALSAMLALALVGPVTISAQDATPEAGAGETTVPRTDVRYLLPIGPTASTLVSPLRPPLRGSAGSRPPPLSTVPMPGTASAPIMRSSIPASSRRC
jgi:hypothetical protein